METGIEFGEIENVLQQILERELNFEVMVQELVESGDVLSVGKWSAILGKLLVEQFRYHGKAIWQLILLVVCAAILATVAKAFRNRQISDMGFYMIYLLLFLIMMRSFGICYGLTENVIIDLVDFMKVLMPAYLLAVAASAYRTSAVLYYEGFLLLIYYLQKLVAFILLPAIRCYVMFTMLGHLGKEEFFARGRKGMKSAILFVMKSMIGVTAGLQLIQGMISPAIDELKHTAISKGVSSLGNIGNIAQNITDVMLGAGMLLKNGIGAAGAIVIVIICMVPVIQVGCYAVFYHFLAAATEPVSDKKITNAIGDMGEGLSLLVKLLFTVATLFLLTIAMICVTTGGIV